MTSATFIIAPAQCVPMPTACFAGISMDAPSPSRSPEDPMDNFVGRFAGMVHYYGGHIVAAMTGDGCIYLHAAGVDPDQSPPEGGTPLHEALADLARGFGGALEYFR